MPVISNLVYTTTESTIVAVWTTDVSADSNLTAGGKAAIDNGVAANSTNHQCIVTGLSPGTIYSCVVTSGGTSSSPQNVSTNIAPTRTPISSMAIGSAFVQQGPSSSNNLGDTFYNFQADDGSTYVVADDTNLFNGANNVNMLVAKFTNNQSLIGTLVDALSGFAGGGGTAVPTAPADGPAGIQMDNKFSGILSMAGSLYGFIARQTLNQGTGTLGQIDIHGSIIRSNDHGVTWNNWLNLSTFTAAGAVPSNTTAPWFFGNADFGWVSPVVYAADDGTLGYNTAGNGIDGANGFIYMTIMPRIYGNFDYMYLGRMPRIQVAAQNPAAMQFWIGPTSPAPADFVNDANWTTNSAATLTRIYSATAKTSAPQIVYVPGLNYYMLLTWYRPDNTFASSNNSTWVFSAGPTPAGPWTQIATQLNTPSGWYNPTINHASLLGNTLRGDINLNLLYAGDFNNQSPFPNLTYYHPTQSQITLNPSLKVSTFVAAGSASGTNLSAAAFVATAGNTLIAHVRPNTSSVTSIQDTAGNVYVPVSTSFAGWAGTGRFYICNNCKGNAANVVQANFSASDTFTGLMVWQIPTGGLTFDVDTSTKAASGTLWVSSSFNTTFPNEIVLMAAYQNTAALAAPGVGMFNDGTAGNFVGCGAHKVFQSKQTGATVGATQAVSAAAVQATLYIATFASVGGGGSGMAGEMLAANRYCSRMWP